MRLLVYLPCPLIIIVPFITVGINVLLEMRRYVRDVCPLLVSVDMQFNAKWTYILCVILFELGSTIYGAVISINALIIKRAICGISGSGIYIRVITLLAIIITIHEYPMYISSTSLT
jgi:hypothetical protein